MATGSLFMGLSALASGALFAFSNVGFANWWFAFVCFVPILVVIDRARPRVRTAFLLGTMMGGAVYFVGYAWLLALGGDFIAGTPATIYSLWSAYGLFVALHFGVVFALYQWLRRHHVKTWTAFAFSLLLVESLQLNLFPFYLGASLVHAPFMAQAADLGGVYLLTAVLAVINAALAGTLRRLLSPDFEGVAHVLLALIGFGVLWMYGLSAELKLTKEMASVEPDQKLSIGVVQGSMEEPGLNHQRLKVHQKYLELSRELTHSEALDLLVWPENSYGVGLLGAFPINADLIRQDVKTPILFGGTRVHSDSGQSRSSNSVFLIDREGVIHDHYGKIKLIPFAEYLPFVDSVNEAVDGSGWYVQAVRKTFTAHQNFLAGERYNALELDGTRFSTPICYEAVMPAVVRHLVKQGGADVIISIANDSWFGASQEPRIHLAMSRLRAIEHRKWFVRAANNGISAVINPLGRLTREIGLGIEGTRVAEISARSEQSFFTRYGNWSLWLLLLVVMAELVPRNLWRFHPIKKRFTEQSESDHAPL